MNSHHNFVSKFCKSVMHSRDGIYYADSSEKISYPDEGNDQSFEIEDNSFWFRHRNNCITEMISNYPPTGNVPIFDIGGGNGFVAKGLMNAGWETVVVEPGPSGARNAKKRGLPNVICATTNTAKFKSGTLPAVGVFDVVEHIEDDVGFLNHLWDLLVPGGMLYVTVPAYQALWSHEDADGGHFRRYRLNNLNKKFSKSGFQLSYSTYIFSFLPFIIFLLRTLPFRLNLVRADQSITSVRKDHSSPNGLYGRVLKAIMTWELSRIRKNRSILLGGSCMVTAKKPI